MLKVSVEDLASSVFSRWSSSASISLSRSGADSFCCNRRFSFFGAGRFRNVFESCFCSPKLQKYC